MKELRIADILALPDAEFVGMESLGNYEMPGISTDTRSLRKGEIYLAIAGQRYDGHDFVDEAFKKGAVAAIVNTSWYAKHGTAAAPGNYIIVRDALQFYGTVANYYRRKHHVRVIGITGSNGKTTTKEMLRNVLATKYDVLATVGNYNNHIGVPQTLLRLEPRHEVAIIEMGTNQPGDIAALCAIAEPTYGIITNIGRSHLELLHTLEQVADEKMNLYKALPPDGVAVINADDKYLRNYTGNGIEVVSFGYDAGADVQVSNVRIDRFAAPTGTFHLSGQQHAEVRIGMKTPGVHNIYAAAASLAMGSVLGCDLNAMTAAIEAFEGTYKRMQIHNLGDTVLIDDSYNANPESTRSAIDTLAAMNVHGRRILVLGDMLELGDNSSRMHKEVGEYAAEKGLDMLLSYGTLARLAAERAQGTIGSAIHYDSQEALIKKLKNELKTGDAVLVKGSRAMNLSSIVDSILEFGSEVAG